MNCLPVVARELRVQSRRPATYRGRVCAGILGLVAVGFVLLAVSFGMIPVTTPRGEATFFYLSMVFLLPCLLAGLLWTADCLAEERREGTLGLLLLTPLRGSDVLIGKLASSSLGASYWLAGLVPLLSLILLMGGVKLADVARASLALANALFFSLSVGLWVSCFVREARQAMVICFGAVFIISSAPLIAANFLYVMLGLFNHPEDVIYLCVSPLTSMLAAFANNRFHTPEGFWTSIAVVHSLSWGLLLWGARLLGRTIRTESEGSGGLNARSIRLASPSNGTGVSRVDGNSVPVRSDRWRRRRARMLDRNPHYWKVGRDAHKTLHAFSFLLVMALMAAWIYQRAEIVFADSLIGIFWLTALIFKVWIAAETIQHCFDERKSGSFELLLCTPQTERDFIDGLNLGLRHRFGPAVLVFCGIALWFSVLPGDWSGGLGISYNLGIPVMLLVLGADLWAIKWAAAQASLMAASSSRALASAGIRVLLWPSLMALSIFVLQLVSGILPFSDDPWRSWILILALVSVVNDAYIVRRLRQRFPTLLRRMATANFDHRSTSTGDESAGFKGGRRRFKRAAVLPGDGCHGHDPFRGESLPSRQSFWLGSRFTRERNASV